MDAKDKCAELDSILPSIHYPFYLRKFASSLFGLSRGFWVGGIRAADANGFLWVDKSKFEDENWLSDDSKWDGSCIQVRGDQKLNALPCKERLPYVCEKSQKGT